MNGMADGSMTRYSLQLHMNHLYDAGKLALRSCERVAACAMFFKKPSPHPQSASLACHTPERQCKNLGEVLPYLCSARGMKKFLAERTKRLLSILIPIMVRPFVMPYNSVLSPRSCRPILHPPMVLLCCKIAASSHVGKLTIFHQWCRGERDPRRSQLSKFARKLPPLACPCPAGYSLIRRLSCARESILNLAKSLARICAAPDSPPYTSFPAAAAAMPASLSAKTSTGLRAVYIPTWNTPTRCQRVAQGRSANNRCYRV